MAKNTALEAIKFMERYLIEGGLNISKIILFGSQAEGETTDESDIDIVIISENFQGKDIFQRAAIIKDAEIMTVRKFIIPMDIITMTPEEFGNSNSLIAEYARNGELI